MAKSYAVANITKTAGNLGYIKVWNGSAWEWKPVKYWTGSAWLQKPLKYWNGSQWITTSGT